MCKTNFSVVIFYDGTRSAKEVLNDAIAAKVRRKIDNDIEILEGKEYNQVVLRKNIRAYLDYAGKRV